MIEEPFPTSTPLLPDGLEIAYGSMLGNDEHVKPLSRAEADGLSLREAIERSILEGLRRPPCFVSFSGGRDSSAILALACLVARREGLSPPHPLTMRFDDDSTADETRWQHLVLDTIEGAGDWEIVDTRKGLDLLGRRSGSVLRRHGVVFPANAYMHVPLLEIAQGGSLITGIGGDELLGAPPDRIVDLLAGRRRLRRGDLRRIAAELAPRLTLGTRLRPHPATGMDWLTGHARALILDRYRSAVLPISWAAGLRQWVRNRYYVAGSSTLRLIGHDHGVRVVSPFFERSVLAAATLEFGWSGYRDRTEAMQRIFGDLLPEQVVRRSSKAEFSSATWGPSARLFAATWDGAGVPDELVDADTLRTMWNTEKPHWGTAMLMQQAALAGGWDFDDR